MGMGMRYSLISMVNLGGGGKGGSGRRLTREREKGGTEGREGKRGQERLGGLLFVTCQITSLKSTLMVPVGREANKSMRYVSCEHI